MKKKRFDYPLPEELTVEILLRIPFESILECKLVCKQWKNLINDPKFYNRYGNSRSVFLYLGHNGLNRLTVITKFTGNQFPTYNTRRIPVKSFEDCMNVNRSNSILLSGSSKWIACVISSRFDKFVLHNLFTGCSCVVDMAPIREVDKRSCISLKGFGYDRHANDYKIFMRYDSDETGLFWIYSFKKPGWKVFNGFPNSDYRVTDFVACSFNGVLHWLCTRRDKVLVVVTYDLHSCRFGEILLPDIGVASDYIGARLSELDGRLCFVHHTDSSYRYRTVHVWVMNEYGVRESWTKLLDIDRPKESFIWDKNDIAVPTLLYETKKGRKFVLFSQLNCVKLFWYDLNKNNIQEVDTCSRVKSLRN